MAFNSVFLFHLPMGWGAGGELMRQLPLAKEGESSKMDKLLEQSDPTIWLAHLPLKEK